MKSLRSKARRQAYFRHVFREATDAGRVSDGESDDDACDRDGDLQVKRKRLQESDEFERTKNLKKLSL